ncbi:MAG: beta-propeller domain-containing protein [Acidimicrobiia bacterium]
MRRIITALAATIAVLASACSGIATTTTDILPAPGGAGIFAAGAAIEPFDSCDGFLDYAKGHALDLVGPYGLTGYQGPYVFEEFAVTLDSAATRQESAPTNGAVKGSEYSGTNVQVAGVDEPDLVKTDGERIFVIAQGKLIWIDASATPEVVATLTLDGWGQQMFLSGDRLLVMTSGGGYGIEPLVGSRDAIGIAPQTQRTVLIEVDVGDASSMEAVRTMTIDGTTLSSRMADGSVRVVVRSEPMGFAWVYPEGSGLRAEKKAVEANRKLIEESMLDNWVPWYVLEDHESGTIEDGPLLACDQVGHPNDFSGLSMLTVLTLELDDGLAPGAGIGLMAEGQTIYASHKNLYVATAPWQAWQVLEVEETAERPETLTTQIHMFDISDHAIARYVASGEVDGTLLSQWSMDEYNDVLRVVVTDENPWWGTSDVPDTSVLALELRGTELTQIGSVDGLGKNERVYAVRFIQDKGYVVTFRQVDPLYVVDLSDPNDPTVTGELKINGYSAYLHPIGEDLLLGVGQDATSEGRIQGTQVSVFDVSNPTDPRRMSRLTFEDAHSEAEWDHHAFLWWAQDDIAVLPLQRWSWDEKTGTERNFSGAVVVSASESRVTQVGEIRHPNSWESECEGCEGWAEPINRSLVIGDTLYTFSQAGMLASGLDTLEDITWLEFS